MKKNFFILIFIFTSILYSQKREFIKESLNSIINQSYKDFEVLLIYDDDNYNYVAAWEYMGKGEVPKLHKEKLHFEFVKLTGSTTHLLVAGL